jgi:rhamnulokinase
VFAGPVEATALGNVLVQGRAQGPLSGTLEDLRALVARTHEPAVHLPTGRGAHL